MLFSWREIVNTKLYIHCLRNGDGGDLFHRISCLTMDELLSGAPDPWYDDNSRDVEDEIGMFDRYYTVELLPADLGNGGELLDRLMELARTDALTQETYGIVEFLEVIVDHAIEGLTECQWTTRE